MPSVKATAPRCDRNGPDGLLAVESFRTGDTGLNPSAFQLTFMQSAIIEV